MSDQIAELTPEITNQSFNNFLQSREKSKFTGVVDIRDLAQYSNNQIQDKLFLKGVPRVPFFGFQKGDRVEILGLVTNEKRQEHSALLEDLASAGYTKNDIRFSSSIECGGTGHYMLRLNGNPSVEISLGRGSDLAVPQLTPEGRKMLEEIFNGRVSLA